MGRQPLSEEHRARIGATMLGIPLQEYQENRAGGLKWCFGCRAWQTRATFPRRVGTADDDLSNECRDCVNPRAREAMRARRVRQLAAQQATSR